MVFGISLIVRFPILLLGIGLASSEKWTTYLNSDYVNQILPKDSLVWCATTGGVAVLGDPDDTSFTKITNADGLMGNSVLRLACDDAGDWWFLCGGGVSVMRADGDTWADFTHFWNGIPGENLLSIAIDGNYVWLGTDEGGWVWDTGGDPFNWTGGQETFHFKNDTILTILPDGQYVWLGTKGGICRALKQSPEEDTLWFTTAQGLPSDEVRSLIYVDTVLWAGTGDGVARLEDTIWIAENQGLPSRDVRSLAAEDTIIWAGTAKGTARFSGVAWDSLNQGLLSRDISCVAVDPGGVVWAGTAGKGIAEFVADSSFWRHHLSEGPAGNSFSSIALDWDGGLWCTHYLDPMAGKLVSRFHNGEWEIYNQNNQWQTGNIRWVVVDREGNKWFGVWDTRPDWGGVVKLESDNVTFRRYQTPRSAVMGAIAVDTEGNKWFSAYNGAVLMLSSDDSTWTAYSNDYTVNIITIAADREGNKYFGSWLGDGLSMLSAGGNWGRIEGLPSNLVWSLEVDNQDNLWVGTTGGVAKVADGQVVEVFTVGNTQGRLLGDPANDITVDWAGGVWFEIQSEGVNRLYPDGSWAAYTPQDGLASDEIYDRVDGLAFDTESGVLWIGTKYGLSRFETELIPEPPEVDSIEVYPNPFIPSEGHQQIVFSRVPDAGAVWLYTLSGELIKRIRDVDQLTHQTYWDGRNEAGEEVASGIYLFLVVGGDEKKVGKIAVIR